MRIKRTIRSRLPLILFVFAAVATFMFFAMKKPVETSAASLAGFKPGNIISDYTMSNYNSMSEADIQNFLKSKNSCNDTRTYLASAYPEYSYHIKDGHFVCLADETFGDGIDYGDSAPTGQSAAHIIWQAAQDYQINPQVLIVLLQKEQSLITDTWPNSRQFRSATGYGCPDTAACDTKYYGFKNQVRNAASLFRTVLNGGWTNYPLGNNYIQYNPNAACGGSTVYIENLATSALYRYTPYQPNAGAIAAGYGTAPSCGAYGNRNFYLYFVDWFGDPASGTNKNTIQNNNRIPDEPTSIDFKYNVAVEKAGWLDEKNGGQMIGTSGYGLAMEALTISLDGVEFRAHIQNIGWENSFKKSGEISGSSGSGRQIEAVQIHLTGELAKTYDIYYRAHVENIGWMGWVKNDEIAGTVGRSLQIEAMQVKIVEKPSLGASIEYYGHVQDYGWMSPVKNGELAGTTGQAKRVEAIVIKLNGDYNKDDIQYRAHVQDYGWLNWVSNGELAGTTGQAKRVEAIEIKLLPNNTL